MIELENSSSEEIESPSLTEAVSLVRRAGGIGDGSKKGRGMFSARALPFLLERTLFTECSGLATRVSPSLWSGVTRRAVTLLEEHALTRGQRQVLTLVDGRSATKIAGTEDEAEPGHQPDPFLSLPSLLVLSLRPSHLPSLKVTFLIHSMRSVVPHS